MHDCILSDSTIKKHHFGVESTVQLCHLEHEDTEAYRE